MSRSRSASMLGVWLAYGGAAAIFIIVGMAVALRAEPFPDGGRVADVDGSVATVDEAGRPVGPTASGSSRPGVRVPGVLPGADSDDGKLGPIVDIANSRAAQDEFTKRLNRNDLKGALKSLISLIEIDPNAPKESRIREAIMDLSQRIMLVQGPEPDEMFNVLSTGMGPIGIDILYQLLTTKGGSRAAKYAEKLLERTEILERGSKAVVVAYKMRKAKGCESKKALFGEAMEHGDGRTQGQLHLLNHTCGRRRRADPTCCMHKDPDLEATIAAIKARGYE